MNAPPRSPRIVLDVGTSLDVREAIALPWVLARLPRAATVTLDFRHVTSLHKASSVALTTALASVTDRIVTSLGLPRVVGLAA